MGLQITDEERKAIADGTYMNNPKFSGAGALSKNMTATLTRTQSLKEGKVVSDSSTYNIIQDNSNKSSKSQSTTVQSAPVTYNDPLLNDLMGSA